MNTKFNLFYIFHILNDIVSFEENEMYEVHFRCLENINRFFKEAIFVITVDDLNNPLITSLKHKLSNEICYNIKNITFIVEQNNKLEREGYIFKKYVIDKLNKLWDENTLVFFAHTKGIYNYTEDRNVAKWVISMYYFCLNNVECFMYDLLRDKILSYGFPCFDNCPWNENINFIYAGSFQVFSPSHIYKYIIDNNIDLNKTLYYSMDNNRFMMELFLPTIIKNKDIDKVGYAEYDRLKKYHIKWPMDIYDPKQYDTFLRSYIPYTVYNKFIKFYDEITLDLRTIC